MGLIEPVESLWTANGEMSANALPKNALGESPTLLAAMVEQMPVALGLMNAKAQLILCNQKMRRYVPYFTMPRTTGPRISAGAPSTLRES